MALYQELNDDQVVTTLNSIGIHFKNMYTYEKNLIKGIEGFVDGFNERLASAKDPETLQALIRDSASCSVEISHNMMKTCKVIDKCAPGVKDFAQAYYNAIFDICSSNEEVVKDDKKVEEHKAMDAHHQINKTSFQNIKEYGSLMQELSYSDDMFAEIDKSLKTLETSNVIALLKQYNVPERKILEMLETLLPDLGKLNDNVCFMKRTAKHFYGICNSNQPTAKKLITTVRMIEEYNELKNDHVVQEEKSK